MDPLSLQTEHVELQQTRQPFTDPTSPITHFLTNALLYSSHYYPLTKSLLTKLIHASPVSSVAEAITHLYGCLEREVIYGPSAGYYPPNDLPQMYRADMLLVSNPPTSTQSFVEVVGLLHLEQLFCRQDCLELEWYSCSRLLSMSQQHRTLYKLYGMQLDLQGENFLESTPLGYLLLSLSFCCRCLLEGQTESELPQVMEVRRLYCRLSLLHNRLLKNPVECLSGVVLSNYELCVRNYRKQSREEYVELLLEYSYALLFYYKYAHAQQLITYCCDALQIQMEFTGRLGRRTKYQTFDVAQLVANFTDRKPLPNPPKHQEQDQTYGELIDARHLLLSELGLSPTGPKEKVERCGYEQESILMETPLFAEKEQRESMERLSNVQWLSMLCAIHHGHKTVPHDEMYYQRTNASIATLLGVDTTFNYPMEYGVLLIRSINEFPRVKHTERALQQMEKLNKYYNLYANKNVRHLYATPYETRLTFLLILASHYMQIGLSITAVQLYQQAGLYQQCIDALFNKNFKQKALQLALALLAQKGKSPRLLCMLGDLQDNVELYHEAWELSQHSYSRAMRSLGWHYYIKKDYRKAAQCFSLSVKASRYNPSAWFTLGCCYMNVEEYGLALRAFSECIIIDESQGQAWGNMASCYMHDKKWKEAYSTLIQAVKYSQAHWKLWANLLSVSLKVKQFYKYFESIQKLVSLGHSQLITREVLDRLVHILKYKCQSETRKRIPYNFKERITKLFAFLEAAIGEQSKVWSAKCDFQIQLIQYTTMMDHHYDQSHRSHSLDLNDLVPGYEQPGAKGDLAAMKRAVVQAKQTQLNMAMKIGWHQDKLQCAEVKLILLEYVQIYRDYSSREDAAEFKLFLSGVSSKISSCLEEDATVDCSWL